MKKFAQTFLVCACLLFVAGCASTFTKTPVVNPTTGATNFSYAISEQTSNTLEKIRSGISAVPDLGPQVELGKDAALGALALVSGVLGLIARIKTGQANMQKQAADLLAAQIVSANQQVDALKVASGTTAFQTVAQHIDNNTIK